MSDDINVEFDMSKLGKFMKSISDISDYKIKVGILGEGRNAEVGAYHEFGTSKIPQRSFLRGPLTTRLTPNLEASKLLDEESIKKCMEDGDSKNLITKIAFVAENTIQEAFQKENDGTEEWADWAPGYESKTGMKLQDTQQLRDSISSEVSK